jgi:predicted DCC family thiol-disulfide oxidoreductase YuxK
VNVDKLDGLMLFDGVCNLCSGSVALAIRMDKKRALRFTPLQSPFGNMLAVRYGLNFENPDSFIFFDNGQALQGSDALIALARRLGRPWSFAAVFRVLPRRWRDDAYHLLARNRYRLMGRRDSCMSPTPAQRAQFLLDVPD